MEILNPDTRFGLLDRKLNMNVIIYIKHNFMRLESWVTVPFYYL